MGVVWGECVSGRVGVEAGGVGVVEKEGKCTGHV